MKSLSINTIGTGLLALLGCLVHLCGVLPMMRSAKVAKEAEHETARLLQNVDARAAENATLDATIASLEGDMLAQYPLTIGTDRPTIETLSTLLATHQLSLQNLRESVGSNVEGTRIDLQITGEYRNIVLFLFDLGRMQIPAEINSLQVSNSKAGSSECHARVVVNFFPEATLAFGSDRKKIVMLHHESKR